MGVPGFREATSASRASICTQSERGSVTTNSGSEPGPPCSGRSSCPALKFLSTTTPETVADKPSCWFTALPPPYSWVRACARATSALARCASAWACSYSLRETMPASNNSVCLCKARSEKRASACALAVSACAAPNSGEASVANTCPACTDCPTSALSLTTRPAKAG